MRKEIHTFLQEVKQGMHEKFSDQRFLMFLAFLVDIFGAVNSINRALQGKDINMLHCHEKLTTFKMKLALLRSKLDSKNFAPFPQLYAFLDENELQRRYPRGDETPRFNSWRRN